MTKEYRATAWAFLDHLRGIVMGAHAAVVRLILGERPVPLSYLWCISLPLKWMGEGALMPLPRRRMARTAEFLPFELKELLGESELGMWAMDDQTIAYLWKELQRRKPRTILECGAGVSTLVLAAYAASQPDREVHVVSVEQSEDVRRATAVQLRSRGIGERVNVLHVPLNEAGSYDLQPDELLKATVGRPFDCVVIDGPAGPSGCRTPILPAVTSMCAPGARWFLDDALRGSEINTLASWSSRNDIEIAGVVMVGKGLAIGIVRGSSVEKCRSRRACDSQ